jgi:hypothetical protein
LKKQASNINAEIFKTGIQDVKKQIKVIPNEKTFQHYYACITWLDLVDTTLQQGQQIVLNATGPGLTYFWSTGATTPTITVNSMGTYSVTVTNNEGCIASDAVVITIITSTNELRDKYKIFVSPNPTDEILNIIFQGGSTSLAQIIDNLGKVVTEDKALISDGAKRTLSLEKIPSGLYYLRLVGNGCTMTVSIVKQ